MLVSLSIKNFALIEKLSIDFSNGFTIITGETGAGKSILLGALGLVLGKRADLSSLKNENEKCVVEAHFDISKYNLKSFFETNDLDFEPITIIRREILPTGKSRAFINDSPVNLSELSALSDFLIDIHSQHQTSELSEDSFQFQMIDAFASNGNLLSEYGLLLKDYKNQKSSLESKKTKLIEVNKEQDYNLFLSTELQEAQLVSGQQEEFESLQEQLSNVTLIQETFEKAISISDNEQFGIHQNIKELKNTLSKIKGFSKEFEAIFERIDSVSIEFKDVLDEIVKEASTIENDPEQLEKVNQKLQLIYALQKKHHVNSVEELLEIQNELDHKIISVSNLENDIQKLEKSILELEIKLNKIALQLHEKRVKESPKLIQNLIEILTLLGMPNVQFKMEFKLKEHFYTNGTDELNFLFSANKGSDFGILKKIASGGELSRIMLATKAILANFTKLPTIIFDEIDTGVSGEIADKMGDIMKKMSQDRQVFAITHLPQIAAKGNSHYKVYKATNNEQTVSELKLLTKEERIVEIAQMLSGATISESAINHAKALLN